MDGFNQRSHALVASRLASSLLHYCAFCKEREALQLSPAPMGALLHTGRSSGGAAEEHPTKAVKEFCDKASVAWESVWGEHMHQGFYEPGAAPQSAADHRAAQVRIIEEALRFAGVSDDPVKRPKSIVDVGCGIGGSSRYLVKKYGSKCTGFTISPVEIERARVLTAADQGLADKVSFQVADALEQPFPDGQFDLVWAMAVAEHTPDKRKLMSELVRVAQPGGIIVMVTWCHRDLLPSEDSLRPDELNLLNRIDHGLHVPNWCSAADFVNMAHSLSLQDIKSADWSENVAPFWSGFIRTRYTWQRLASLLGGGWKTIRASLATSLFIEGFNKGLLRFVIITCRKPVIMNEEY